MASEILQNLFFIVDYVFGILIPIYFAGLILVGIAFAFIFAFTKR